MKSINELLEIRTEIKRKKPEFVRQDIRKKKRLERKWRKPKGMDSKIRLRLKGRPKAVSTGYGSPKNAKHLHKSGLMQHVLKSEKELERLNPKEYCIALSSTLGNRKRVVILKKARELGFNVVNVNADEYIKKVEAELEARKQAKKKEVTEKTEKKEVKSEEDKSEDKNKKKEEKEEKLSDKLLEEDKKELEKKEKDKLLIKKVK
ncbi:50S ribosomal protein L32e [Candidatus Woesearchaeota archaeon]|nr:50S ribosomal protein L32e [Candidatus Woesearchaeota archaeon]